VFLVQLLSSLLPVGLSDLVGAQKRNKDRTSQTIWCRILVCPQNFFQNFGKKNCGAKLVLLKLNRRAVKNCPNLIFLRSLESWSFVQVLAGY
jgi:hypothetical protein